MKKARHNREQKVDAIFASIILGVLSLMIVCVFAMMVEQATKSKDSDNKPLAQTKQSKTQRIVPKSQADKEAVMAQDLVEMDSLGLYYDYANLSLEETVKAYMSEFGLAEDSVALSYKDLTTGQTAALNDTQPMTAGSTYKLPLNMLVMDKVAKGDLSLTERYDITQTTYEYIEEHNSYVAAFNGAMTIPEMQEYSLVYSENTPAYALAERLGGIKKAYQQFGRYGKSKGALKTISQEGNKTTTDYYIQVLEYLYQHSDKYADLLYYLEIAFPNQYYRGLLGNSLTIAQKPGYVREALNVGAIVYEEKPYIVALYTKGLGGSDETSTEINPYGYYQLTQLCYVINEWHRVNMN
ncbi:serine hydrolase [Streptococcus sp. zg-JUN1979]|uniref:serine hydrolase n=1 Tax=Streptococcus sp. zg-JUN1979 TaxID=3391450 RepID=UPI0039A68366